MSPGTEPSGLIAVARNDEQEADIAERKGDDDPALQQHGSGSSGGRSSNATLSHHGTGENRESCLAGRGRFRRVKEWLLPCSQSGPLPWMPPGTFYGSAART